MSKGTDLTSVPSLLSLVAGAGFEPTSLGSRLKAVLIYHIVQNDGMLSYCSIFT